MSSKGELTICEIFFAGPTLQWHIEYLQSSHQHDETIYIYKSSISKAIYNIIGESQSISLRYSSSDFTEYLQPL